MVDSEEWIEKWKIRGGYVEKHQGMRVSAPLSPQFSPLSTQNVQPAELCTNAKDFKADWGQLTEQGQEL